ncbi:hypothetical protein [Pseudoduganella umbonata]|uniref:Uncharacterized protein n=1 Tax=Pseudoduganella umbonata TaxID=864828 RepID=A0A4V1ED55_9BURK|nr:hypothetical protein [Pseudoduganella umbonata]MBB3219874.1 hypothetical protein [Pseudoduganella umbonata]QCP09901.1 hypothetical protein FCL38_05280 [Pseudoduganella umbonata]
MVLSALQADAHQVLAHTGESGGRRLSCFPVPRFLPDETLNGLRVQRLQGKPRTVERVVEVECADGFRPATRAGSGLVAVAFFSSRAMDSAHRGLG